MNFIKRQILFLILISFLIACTIYWFYWHWRPFTADAFVFANTRAVSPWVEGYISNIYVKNNQFVKKGTPLFSTSPYSYSLKTAESEHELAAAKSQLESCRARLLRAEAEIRRQAAELEQFNFLYSTGVNMLRQSAISEDYVVRTKCSKISAEAQHEAAQHKKTAIMHECVALESLVKKLEKTLALSQYWLSQTTVTALSDGIVTNMTISPGMYGKPGDVLFGFIDTSVWFIQANFKESELSEIRPGVKAVIRLRQYPGRVYQGFVEQVNWSAEKRQSSAGTGLTEVKKENEWFLLPQRFPVQIRITNPDEKLHFGASAYVVLDIPAHPIRQFFWELFL
jgi:multidrug resistance efflux pump